MYSKMASQAARDASLLEECCSGCTSRADLARVLARLDFGSIRADVAFSKIRLFFEGDAKASGPHCLRRRE